MISVFSSLIITGSCLPVTTFVTIFFVVSYSFFICSDVKLVPTHLELTLDISNIPSTYFFGNPNVRPSHFAAAKSDVFNSSKSFSVTLITSMPFWGGGAYTKPTPSFLCLTSIECCNASIFISLLHSKIFPSPKNSATITYSLSNPANVK